MPINSHDHPSLVVDLSSYLVPPTAPPRKYQRQTKLPTHLQDYVCNNTIIHWCNLVSSDQLPLSHASFLASNSSYKESKSYATPIKDPLWVQAMQSELEALDKNNT